MKNIKKILLIPLFAIVCMFVRIDSAMAADYPFSVTTSSIAANGTFQFKLSAKGTFHVDCGTGGTLSSDDSTANGMISSPIPIINKTDTKSYTFKCTYSSAGTKTIRFGGTATQYNTGTSITTIGFNLQSSRESITSISGDLTTIFPYISATNGYFPRFYGTFYGCSGLTSIPENLFSFGGNNILGQDRMFYETFRYCSGLTSLPENLFSRVTSGGTRMFYRTFSDCTGLTGYIPPSMFSGLIANGSPYSGSGNTGTMYQTFYDTGSLRTSCPSGTTQYTTGYEDYWDGHVSCIEQIIALTWYDGNSTISGPSACAVGGVFLPPTPPARTGYIFNGWKIKSVNP